MKYFYDTEFLEGVQGLSTKPTIDLISIGIVSEDGREYYAISNQFNVTEAWNRNDGTLAEPKYWIRENILKQVYADLCKIQEESDLRQYDFAMADFELDNLNWLIQQHGKSLQVLAKEIEKFINPKVYLKTELVGYYSAYDHVVFSWIFGKMIDLPKNMPMYTYDLKQELDRVANLYFDENANHVIVSSDWHNDYPLNYFKFDMSKRIPYPKNFGEHNALEDAKWNRDLSLWLDEVKRYLKYK